MRRTRKAFREWLESFKPDEVVGEARSHRCPLTGCFGPGTVTEALNGDGRSWRRRFMWVIDRGRRSSPPVTAAEALAALDEIEAEMKR